MPRLDKSQIKKGMFLTGAPCKADGQRGFTVLYERPPGQPPKVTLLDLTRKQAEIEQRIANLKARVAKVRS